MQLSQHIKNHIKTYKLESKYFMKHKLSNFKATRYGILLYLVVISAMLSSCRDDFFEVNKPSWLGESIYDQLVEGYTDSEGKKYSFTVYIKLIEDIGYREVLERTGSKTLFVSDDTAFERFFQSNAWGVKSYEELSMAQKRLILNSSMINNAYLIELMSSTEGPVEGLAIRRPTALSILDSIPMEKGSDLPAEPVWDFYRDKGIRLLKDNTPVPMIHFLQKQLDYAGITDDDLSVIFNGFTRRKNDAHIFGNRVVVRDITCKNGYINILENVLIPPSNMAEVIRKAPETTIFSSMLERFAAPFYDGSATMQYRLLNPEFNDSIFVKRYYAERSGTASGSNLTSPKGIGQSGYLEFDPGWNNYRMNNTTTMDIDMGTMFVPEDNILRKFFYEGGGKFLIERYGSIENIPTDRIDDLLRNHMKSTFLGSIPRRFPEILDDGKEPMGISKGDVVKSYVANNGVIFVTNKVYAPASFVAVTAPALVNEQMKIFNWGVDLLQYNAYLLSMDSYYSFMVPTDRTEGYDSIVNKGMMYIDPVSLAKVQPEVFKFWWNGRATSVADRVRATAYKYDPLTGEVGDSIRPVTPAEIRDRLDDIIDNHIIVGNIEGGRAFYQTKNGGFVKITGSGVGMKIQGGGNLETGIAPAVTKIYDQTKATNGRGNGKTYVLTSPVQTPFKSVFKILSETPEFSEFFKLLQGNDEATEAESKLYDIFVKDKSYAGIDLNVKFFNTYHYSVYVPTNEAVLEAIANGLPTWDMIKAEGDQDRKTAMTEKLVNFLRYHFQDNSVFIDGSTSALNRYETAAYNKTDVNKSYYKLYTKVTPSGMTIYSNPDDASTAVQVTMKPGLYNIMAREYKFNNGDPQRATQIETSSYAVIHQINKVLLYTKDQLKN